MTSMLDNVPAAVLRAAADRKDRTDRERTNLWSTLSDTDADAGLGMVAAGKPPGFGWWHARTRPPRARPVVAARPGPERGRWETWELVAAAIGMSDQPGHLTQDDMRTVIVGLAVAHQVGPEGVADAYTALADTQRP